MEKLTTIRVTEGKFSWYDCIRHYYPDATDEECEYILWEETCYPFSTEKAIEQIWKYFNKK